MAEFSLPATPADEDLYNAVCNKAVELDELRRRYHEAECAQLEAAWLASNTVETHDGSSDGR